MRRHRAPFLLCNDLLCPPLRRLLLPLPETFACRYYCALPARYNGHRAALEGEFTVSEQVNCGFTHAFGARLLNHADSAALPVDATTFPMHQSVFTLVDKTMFIADILDSEAPVCVLLSAQGFWQEHEFIDAQVLFWNDLITGCRIEACSLVPRFGMRVAVAIVMSTRVIRSSCSTLQLPLRGAAPMLRRLFAALSGTNALDLLALLKLRRSVKTQGPSHREGCAWGGER